VYQCFGLPWPYSKEATDFTLASQDSAASGVPSLHVDVVFFLMPGSLLDVRTRFSICVFFSCLVLPYLARLCVSFAGSGTWGSRGRSITYPRLIGRALICVNGLWRRARAFHVAFLCTIPYLSCCLFFALFCLALSCFALNR
jgi:hypothetical protein